MHVHLPVMQRFWGNFIFQPGPGRQCCNFPGEWGALGPGQTSRAWLLSGAPALWQWGCSGCEYIEVKSATDFSFFFFLAKKKKKRNAQSNLGVWCIKMNYSFKTSCLLIFFQAVMHIFTWFPRCTGTPVLTFWGRQWSAFMEGVCVMDPPLRMVSTMTCSSMDRSEKKKSLTTLLYVNFLWNVILCIPVLIKYFTSFSNNWWFCFVWPKRVFTAVFFFKHTKLKHRLIVVQND